MNIDTGDNPLLEDHTAVCMHTNFCMQIQACAHVCLQLEGTCYHSEKLTSDFSYQK